MSNCPHSDGDSTATLAWRGGGPGSRARQGGRPPLCRESRFRRPLAPGARHARRVAIAVLLVLFPTAGRASAQTPRGSALAWTFNREELRDLPSGGTVWSLLDAAAPFVISDRIETGGLWTGEPARLAARGSSWRETAFRLDGLDITDPADRGVPLLYPDLNLFDAVVVDATPADAAGPGAVITLVPRRPGATWQGGLEGTFSPAALQTTNARDGTPPAARLDTWADAHASAGGPLGTRAGLLVAAGFTHSRRVDRETEPGFPGDVGSVFVHLVISPTARDEARVIAAGTAIRRPFAARARYADRNIEESVRELHLQSTWEHRLAGGGRWTVTGGFQRATFSQPRAPSIADGRAVPLAGGTVDRLLDGPVLDLVWANPGVHQRLDVAAQMVPGARRWLGIRHDLRVGGDAGCMRAITDAVLSPLIAERVGGFPARVWDVGYLGPQSVWASIETALYAADHAVIGSRLDLDVGLRFESGDGSAEGAANSIRWRTWSPRVSGRWLVSRPARLTAFGGYARYQHGLPLQYFAVGDRTAPGGWVYAWNDTNGDGAFQPLETGQVVGAVGPCCRGAILNTIDPALKRPHTDEVVLGVDERFGDTWTVRFTAIDRREHLQVGFVNAGVTQADYSVTSIPDPGVAGTPQALPVYNQLPASVGRDRYVLTNPATDQAVYQGLELSVVRTFGRRWRWSAGAAAYRSEGRGANRGFRASENDWDPFGETFVNPNARTNARGRLFFDRAYVIKTSGAWRGPHDLRVGAVARYEDGQPFARLVVVPDLTQGPDYVQAYPRGDTRFTFTLTLDARAEKGLDLGRRRVAIALDVFNLLNTANEIEESVVTGPGFRTSTALQPPRVIRLGVRAEF